MAFPSSAQEVGGVKVPDYVEDGVKKSEITGRLATVDGKTGTVDIKEFKIEFYTPEGKIRMEVTAPQCTYNQRGKFAKSKTDMRIVGDKMVVTGEDFAWDAKKEIFKISRNSKVVIRGTGSRINTTSATQTEDTEHEE